MTQAERAKHSRAFKKDLVELMKKHGIVTIRAYRNGKFIGFTEFYGIFKCGRIDAYPDMPDHNKLTTDWKTYNPERFEEDE